MNLNVHYGGSYRWLGLVRTIGNIDSSKVIELAVKKLNQFGFDLNKDIVAPTTDAASVLVKLGKDTSSIHIQ